MREALSLASARRHIDAAVDTITDSERLPLRAALDRVLARDVVASIAVPPHDNAAMDGYALRADDVDSSSPRRLGVVGESRAGHPYTGRVGPNDCVRIMTGALIPTGCDAVVPHEEVRVHDGAVTIERPTRPGQHRRLAGEDLRIGDVAIGRGRRLTPSDLGLAASIGQATLEVTRRVRVAVFSTGDELRDVDAALGAGQVRDSNRYSLIGMLDRLGTDVFDLGIVADDPRALEATLKRACGPEIAADAIVTSGGVSAGDADHTRAVLARLGSVSFWKLDVKPGRPMAFGRIDDGGRGVPLFGLPGNPVAVIVVFYALVRDALLRMMGARVEPVPSIAAFFDGVLSRTPGRTEFMRGVATRSGSDWHVRPTGAQGSGILRSVSEANCLIVIEPERGSIVAGERVDVWPFHGLV